MVAAFRAVTSQNQLVSVEPPHGVSRELSDKFETFSRVGAALALNIPDASFLVNLREDFHETFIAQFG